jgi:hypothetical protein
VSIVKRAICTLDVGDVLPLPTEPAAMRPLTYWRKFERQAEIQIGIATFNSLTRADRVTALLHGASNDGPNSARRPRCLSIALTAHRINGAGRHY